MPQRIEIDVTTGAITVLDLTPDEIAYAQQATADEAVRIANQPPDPVAVLTQQVADLQAALVAKNVIAPADIAAAQASLGAQSVKVGS
jgi:hypothetical protein